MHALIGHADPEEVHFNEYVCALHKSDAIQILVQDVDHNNGVSSAANITHNDRWLAIWDKAASASLESAGRDDGVATKGIDKAEFRRIKRLIRARIDSRAVREGESLIDKKFEEIDSNGDTVISQEEFMSMVSAWQSLLPEGEEGETQQGIVLNALEKSSGDSDFLITNDRSCTLDASEEALVEYIFHRVDHVSTSLS